MLDPTSPEILAARVAISLPLSDWFHDSWKALDLDEPEMEALQGIADRAREDLAHVTALIALWSAGAQGRALRALKADATYGARRAYFDIAIEASREAEAFLQRAARLAPDALSDEFERLGARSLETTKRLRAAALDAT